MIEVGFIIAIAASAVAIRQIDSLSLFVVLNNILLVVLLVGGVVFSVTAFQQNDLLKASLLITATVLTFLLVARIRQSRVKGSRS